MAVRSRDTGVCVVLGQTEPEDPELLRPLLGGAGLHGMLPQLAEAAQEPRNKPDSRDDTVRGVRACDFPVPRPLPVHENTRCAVCPRPLSSMFPACDRIGRCTKCSWVLFKP